MYRVLPFFFVALLVQAHGGHEQSPQSSSEILYYAQKHMASEHHIKESSESLLTTAGIGSGKGSRVPDEGSGGGQGKQGKQVEIEIRNERRVETSRESREMSREEAW
ncbi:hypothetical protein BD410DRAFT_895154 [Rickenella mellea]|uniref:Secreted protein n=1 Tax=Rickenella mellea TaxID=50990 RepID=A0A4Y7QHX6_9AGAM|nr:hypothetical protein BD410DRAFT_895154 [Rickenella mellea]